MSNVVKYLISKSKLKKQLKDNPDNIKYYLKYSSFTGDSDSLKYISKKIKQYYKKTEIS